MEERFTGRFSAAITWNEGLYCIVIYYRFIVLYT